MLNSITDFPLLGFDLKIEQKFHLSQAALELL